MVFDPNVFIEAIEQAAENAVKGGLAQVVERARHKAPVRRIFKGDRKIKFRGAVGVQHLQLNETRGPAFRYAERAAVSVGFLHSGRSFASPVFRGIESSGRGPIETRGEFQSRVKVPASDRVLRLSPEDRIAARGRPNSSQPVIRVEGLGRITGNFRELSGPGQLAHGTIYARVNGRTVRGELSSALTARGAYEVRKGRATNAETGEIGGALRDSIKAEGPFVTRGEVYGFVSAAAFNEQGFNYAYAQEIGTGHNRPQPFLRPALRELKDQIVNSQRTAFNTALRNAHGVRKDFKGFRRVLKLEVQLVGFDRLDQGLGPVTTGEG